MAQFTAEELADWLKLSVLTDQQWEELFAEFSVKELLRAYRFQSRYATQHGVKDSPLEKEARWKLMRREIVVAKEKGLID